MKRLVAAALAVTILTTPVLAMAGAPPAKAIAPAKSAAATGEKKSTIEGEVLDTACYAAHGSKGEKHMDCATKCLNNGMPISILLKDGSVVLLVANHDNEDPYDAAKGMAARQVKVTGELKNLGGMKTMIVEAIEPVAEAAAAKKS
jgi:hypothetical protein